MKAIIIEDCDDKIRMIEILIQQYVMSIMVVKTINEAIPLLTSNQFQIIFLDHNLPDGKGTEYLFKIRKLQKEAKCVSISNDISVINHYKQLGYDDIFEIPFKQCLNRIFLDLI